MLVCNADNAAALQLSVSAVADVAHAAEWNCTVQLDTLDQQLHAELASVHIMLTDRIENRFSSSSRALHLLQKLMCRPDGAQLFSEFDTDGDGTVSKEELREGFAKIGEHLSEEDMDAIMGLVDQDGDGTIGYDEFVQMGKMTEDVALVTEDVEALRMTIQENLAQLKAESEATMVQKIIPLEGSLTQLQEQTEIDLAKLKAESEETMVEKIIPLEETLTQLRQQTEVDLAKLKAESEETMTQKIIPLEQSLATTRDDLESTIDDTRSVINGHVDALRSDLNGAFFHEACLATACWHLECFMLP